MCKSVDTKDFSSSIIFLGVVLCYLLSGGRVSVSLAGIVLYIMAKSKQDSCTDSSTRSKEGNKKCCGGNGGCSSKKSTKKVEKKKVGCCGGSCHSKIDNEIKPRIELSYDENEIDFTESFKKNK